MTKILIFIPAKGRVEIVKECLTHLIELKQDLKDKYFIDILVLTEDIDEFWEYNNMDLICHLTQKGQTLAEKKNQGIAHILDADYYKKFDYLLELDSTGKLSKELFKAYEKEFECKTWFFGISRIAFHDLKSNRLLDYTIQNGGVWVSGRSIRMDVLLMTIAKFRHLWRPDLNNGLGVNQENRILDATKERVKIINTDKPLVLDIKTGEDVTDFETLAAHRNECTEITDGDEINKTLSMFKI